MWLHPAHGGWLHKLTDAGAQLVWNISWGQLAATWVAPRLQLPSDLVVIEHRATGIAWGRQAQLDSLYLFTGDRPVVVLDDEHGGKDHGPRRGPHRRRCGHAACRRRPVRRAAPHRHRRRAALDTRHQHRAQEIMSPTSDGRPPHDHDRHRRRTGRSTTSSGTGRGATDTSPDTGGGRNACNVGDLELGKSRLLVRQGDTCIVNPGNLMRLRAGRLRALINEAFAA